MYRNKDWNLEATNNIQREFLSQSITDTLIITKGQHGPKDRRELYAGCKWLDKMLR